MEPKQICGKLHSTISRMRYVIFFPPLVQITKTPLPLYILPATATILFRSLGVIIFILIGGYPPFDHADQKRKFQHIKKGRFKFKEQHWGTVTEQAKSLITSLLCVDPEKRLSAGEALEHPWMQTDQHKLRRSSLISNKHFLLRYNMRRKFQAAVKSVRIYNACLLDLWSIFSAEFLTCLCLF